MPTGGVSPGNLESYLKLDNRRNRRGHLDSEEERSGRRQNGLYPRPLPGRRGCGRQGTQLIPVVQMQKGRYACGDLEGWRIALPGAPGGESPNTKGRDAA